MDLILHFTGSESVANEKVSYDYTFLLLNAHILLNINQIAYIQTMQLCLHALKCCNKHEVTQ